MTDKYEELSVYRHTFYGVPLTVKYFYSGSGYVELRAVHLPGYPDIDIKDGLSCDWVSTLESDALYRECNEQCEAKDNPEDYESFESLVSILGLGYLESAEGDSVSMIHLFGIRHAEDIRRCGKSVTELVKRSSIPNSYVTEVHKGMRLAKFVKPI